MSRFRFTLESNSKGTRARAGCVHTGHGEVQTPVFMPVGTQATVKTQTFDVLKNAGSRVLLANTYHLMLRPGPEVFRKIGGIHRFMNWDGPVLTDSGGFQIFSLPHERSMQEEGARFASYVDGTEYLLSPESSIDMQKAIGSDIMMVLDQCIPSTASHEQAKAAMELTHRWAVRSLAARGDSEQALFGIVQGACHLDLRDQSAEFLRKLPFDGLAIGGLAVGETKDERYQFTEHVAAQLPEDKPRYLMGVGTPLDLLEGVNSGVDMFDCIIPSQFARRGFAFTSHGKMRVSRAVYKMSEAPLDSNCPCPTCRHYSRAYLHHLVKSDEVLGWQLLCTHNITYYHRLMATMRGHIQGGTFAEFYQSSRELLTRSDEDNPPGKAPRAKKPRVLPKLGDYEVVESAGGFFSVKQVSSGEVMHSVSDPTEEARSLYVEQPELPKRFRDATETPLVIWDVGLGAATNAMAVISAHEAASAEGAKRPVQLISFECDLDPLRLAASDPILFPHLRHRAPHTLLSKGQWTSASGALSWRLEEGDFLEKRLSASPADIILYDPFSYKADSELWRTTVFEALLKQMAGKEFELYTYSASTAVRTSLLVAGLFVSAGRPTGPKEETTIAFSSLKAARTHPGAPMLLGAEWLGRWKRSSAKWPEKADETEKRRIEKGVIDHPQFASP